MKELIDKTKLLRAKCQHHGDYINRLLGFTTVSQDPRSGCFSMIFNQSTLSLELLAYYYGKWQGIPTGLAEDEVERRRRENAERCIGLLKSLFVMAMSSIEFSAKVSIAQYGEHPLARSLIKRQGHFVYLSTIMKRSEKEGLISTDVWNEWDGLFAIRNIVIHNNGIPAHDSVYQIAGMNIVATKNQMLQGRLSFFLDLTDTAIDRYFTWMIAIIEACKTT